MKNTSTLVCETSVGVRFRANQNFADMHDGMGYGYP